MPLISISKAAKLFDVSRPTLQKALKDGTVSGHKARSGGSESWQIDTAELARVYVLRSRNPDKGLVDGKDLSTEREQPLSMKKSNESTAFSGELDREVESLTAELARIRAELEQARTDRQETQKALAAAQAVAEERKRLLDDVMRLLPPPVPNTPAQRRAWWPWRRT